jgi:hypothetical protein
MNTQTALLLVSAPTHLTCEDGHNNQHVHDHVHVHVHDHLEQQTSQLCVCVCVCVSHAPLLAICEASPTGTHGHAHGTRWPRELALGLARYTHRRSPNFYTHILPSAPNYSPNIPTARGGSWYVQKNRMVSRELSSGELAKTKVAVPNIRNRVRVGKGFINTVSIWNN